jgi:outer membrane protein OmpA-like peptidoglycan-associated protein
MHALCAVSGVLTLIYAIATGPGEAPAVAATATSPSPSAADVVPGATEAEAADSAEAVASATPSAAPAGGSAAPAPAVEPPASAAELSLNPAVEAALSQPLAFGSNSSAILTSSVPALDAIAKVLKGHPEVALIEVQGHADARGSDEHNVALTRARADAVVAALAALGVAPARLRAAGYGARCPLNPACGGSEASATCLGTATMEADRRVVFVPLKAGSVSLLGDVVCERGRELIPAEDRAFQR